MHLPLGLLNNFQLLSDLLESILYSLFLCSFKCIVAISLSSATLNLTRSLAFSKVFACLSVRIIMFSKNSNSLIVQRAIFTFQKSNDFYKPMCERGDYVSKRARQPRLHSYYISIFLQSSTRFFIISFYPFFYIKKIDTFYII